ncbi:TetR/AcrR family transcriptional regulator [Enterococcus nangangensis]|uniref:TetR/AcrR family transcriptional regulator n=1 Tax=Enterococcus nangangensis TaxID=2559926 RepID=UPI0010F6C784|nr:TetR/AcrR family transcriptional regulator [Enterococcus nangangensis]
MSRNKYPEVTVEKILAAAERLFLQRGYDQTTIQDIAKELSMTKGAVYHHFASKEEILEAVNQKMANENNPFNLVKERTDLNGLEKLQLAIVLNQSSQEKNTLAQEEIPLLKNPQILAASIDANRRYLSPQWLKLMEEGIADGSIKTAYARELAEVLPLLELWLMPSVFPATDVELKRRVAFIGELFAKMGVPLFNESITQLLKNTLEDINS